MSIAKVLISGTIVSAVEKRATPQGVAVANFTLLIPAAPGRMGNAAGETRLKVICWRGMADVAETLQQGQTVLVEGKLTMPGYAGQDGVQRKQFEIDAASLFVLPGLPQALIPAADASMGGGPNSPRAQQPVMQPMAAASGSGYATAATAATMAAPPLPNLEADLYTVEDDIPF
jgi:single stranded DNA-binding protein